jgi:hypothetical protein
MGSMSEAMETMPEHLDAGSQNQTGDLQGIIGVLADLTPMTKNKQGSN